MLQIGDIVKVGDGHVIVVAPLSRKRAVALCFDYPLTGDLTDNVPVIRTLTGYTVASTDLVTAVKLRGTLSVEQERFIERALRR